MSIVTFARFATRQDGTVITSGNNVKLNCSRRITFRKPNGGYTIAKNEDGSTKWEAQEMWVPAPLANKIVKPGFSTKIEINVTGVAVNPVTKLPVLHGNIVDIGAQYPFKGNSHVSDEAAQSPLFDDNNSAADDDFGVELPPF